MSGNKAYHFLERFGTLLVPASLVSGLCELVFHFGIFENLIFSIGTFLITVCVVFRNWIKQKVHSVLPIIVLISLAAAYLYSYKSILLKDTGLILYRKQSSEVQPNVKNGIKKAQREIWFYGTNFHISLPANKTLLKEKLQQGVDIKYLAHNPYATNAEAVARSFNQSEKEYVSECESFINALQPLVDEIEINGIGPGSFEFKFYDDLPRMRCYVFDPSNTKSTSIFVPYYLDDSPRLPGFVFRNTKEGLVNDYFPLLKAKWNSIDTHNEFPSGG